MERERIVLGGRVVLVVRRPGAGGDVEHRPSLRRFRAGHSEEAHRRWVQADHALRVIEHLGVGAILEEHAHHFLGASPLRGIDHRRQHEIALGSRHRGQADLDRELAPAAMQGGKVAAASHQSWRGIVEIGPHLRSVTGGGGLGHEAFDGLAMEHARLVAEKRVEGGIGPEDAALRVDQHLPHRRRIEHDAPEGIGLVQVGDVPPFGHEVLHLAVRAGHRTDAELDVQEVSILIGMGGGEGVLDAACGRGDRASQSFLFGGSMCPPWRVGEGDAQHGRGVPTDHLERGSVRHEHPALEIEGAEEVCAVVVRDLREFEVVADGTQLLLQARGPDGDAPRMPQRPTGHEQAEGGRKEIEGGQELHGRPRVGEGALIGAHRAGWPS